MDTLCQVKAYLDIISKWGGYFSHLSNIGFVLVKLNIFGRGWRRFIDCNLSARLSSWHGILEQHYGGDVN